MGNYISCTLAGGKHSRSRGIKVIFPSGKIQKFDEAVKAAELMLEMPSFFVVNTLSLHIGRRFSALGADEELECGNVYVMLPMNRLNSVVTPADMGALLLTAKRVSSSKMRVLPSDLEDKETYITMEMESHSTQPKLNLDDIDEDFSVHRLSLCRSKKPLLETIAEEPAVC